MRGVALIAGPLCGAGDLIAAPTADRSRWSVEQMPGGSVTTEGGTLVIRDAEGCTVWWR